MGLIDEDYFKKEIAAVTMSRNLDTRVASVLCEIIDAQPTAYDVDKVIKQIEELQIDMESREYYPSAADIWQQKRL